jgi:hypothetical protein
MVEELSRVEHSHDPLKNAWKKDLPIDFDVAVGRRVVAVSMIESTIIIYQIIYRESFLFIAVTD